MERATRHRELCCIFVVLLALSVRMLLPQSTKPVPRVHDEFSYLLGGETFAKGRLANPPHPLSEFFETFHVNMRPTYASKYPPGQSAMLALGMALFGHPWFGVLISVSLMCGLVCWAIQGWLPPIYGLYGGLFTLLIFGLNHYWVNSYWGGAVAACGGALVLGAVPRLAASPRPTAAAAAAFGIIVLANSRPYEGLVFVCAAGLAFLYLVRGRRDARRLLRVTIVLPMILIMSVGAAAMAYYNFAVTGSPTTLPYSIHQRQHAATPVLWILPPLHPEHRVYRDRFMQELWEEWDAAFYTRIRTHPSWIVVNVAVLVVATLVQGAAGAPLVIALVAALTSARLRKTKSLLILLAVFGAGFCLEKSLLLHYAAPAIPAVILLAMQGMRILRVKSSGPPGMRLGLTMLLLASGVALAALQIVKPQVRQEPQNAVDVRRDVERKLEREGGQDVVVVKYGPNHSPHDEIVYNGPDIDAQKIVWAIDRGNLENQRLIDYYRGRRIWLLQPDAPAINLAPYLPGAADVRNSFLTP